MWLFVKLYTPSRIYQIVYTNQTIYQTEVKLRRGVGTTRSTASRGKVAEPWLPEVNDFTTESFLPSLSITVTRFLTLLLHTHNTPNIMLYIGMHADSQFTRCIFYCPQVLFIDSYHSGPNTHYKYTAAI